MGWMARRFGDSSGIVLEQHRSRVVGGKIPFILALARSSI